MRALALALAMLAGCPPMPPPTPATPIKPEPIVTPERPKREIPPVTVAKARSRFSLEVLGVELVGTVDPAAAKAAHTLTDVMRRLAREDGSIAVGSQNTELIDAKLLVDCSNDEPACMVRIAQALRADRIVYGIVNDLKGEYYVHLTLFDARSGSAVKWTGTTLGSADELEYTAKVAFGSLISRTP
jgi:hypothetical protein